MKAVMDFRKSEIGHSRPAAMGRFVRTQNPTAIELFRWHLFSFKRRARVRLALGHLIAKT
jgi:hypothetical protein